MIEFEIVEAYEIRKTPEEQPRGWSLHIYIPEWGMDIRGMRLLKTKSEWFLQMPSQRNYDLEEKRLITYPVISFIEREKNRNLVYAIREKAIAFVNEKITAEMTEKYEKKPKKKEEK